MAVWPPLRSWGCQCGKMVRQRIDIGKIDKKFGEMTTRIEELEGEVHRLRKDVNVMRGTEPCQDRDQPEIEKSPEKSAVAETTEELGEEQNQEMIMKLFLETAVISVYDTVEAFSKLGMPLTEEEVDQAQEVVQENEIDALSYSQFQHLVEVKRKKQRRSEQIEEEPYTPKPREIESDEVSTPEKEKKARKKKKVVVAVEHDDAKEHEAADERSDTHMPVASRDPSDAWMQKFFEGMDRKLRRKDGLSEDEKKGEQQTDEQEHNE